MEYIRYNKFTKNKYYNWYDNIIQNAISQQRIYDSEVHEHHHALPECLGGTETVILTFQEHYICHWLLTKFTTGQDRYKMIIAMSFFYHFKINKSAKRPLYANKSRAYSNFKKTFIQSRKQFCSDNPSKNPFFKHDVFLFRNINTGETFSFNRYDAAKNTDLSANEVSRLISRGFNGSKKTSSKGWDIWVEDNNCFSGDIESELKSPFLDQILCDHCGKHVNKGNYQRWHGKRCRSNPHLST